MVSPLDLNRVAARLLREPPPAGRAEASPEPLYVEGPARYTPAEVAKTLGRVLDRPVALDMIPRAGWEAAFRAQGFSQGAARSYANMTALTVDGPIPTEHVERGRVTLAEHLRSLVAVGGEG